MDSRNEGTDKDDSIASALAIGAVVLAQISFEVSSMALMGAMLILASTLYLATCLILSRTNRELFRSLYAWEIRALTFAVVLELVNARQEFSMHLLGHAIVYASVLFGITWVLRNAGSLRLSHLIASLLPALMLNYNSVL